MKTTRVIIAAAIAMMLGTPAIAAERDSGILGINLTGETAPEGGFGVWAKAQLEKASTTTLNTHDQREALGEEYARGLLGLGAVPRAQLTQAQQEAVTAKAHAIRVEQELQKLQAQVENGENGEAAQQSSRSTVPITPDQIRAQYADLYNYGSGGSTDPTGDPLYGVNLLETWADGKGPTAKGSGNCQMPINNKAERGSIVYQHELADDGKGGKIRQVRGEIHAAIFGKKNVIMFPLPGGNDRTFGVHVGADHYVVEAYTGLSRIAGSAGIMIRKMDPECVEAQLQISKAPYIGGTWDSATEVNREPLVSGVLPVTYTEPATTRGGPQKNAVATMSAGQLMAPTAEGSSVPAVTNPAVTNGGFQIESLREMISTSVKIGTSGLTQQLGQANQTLNAIDDRVGQMEERLGKNPLTNGECKPSLVATGIIFKDEFTGLSCNN